MAEIDNISPEQLAETKIHEMRKATVALVENTARKKGLKEGQKKERDKGIERALNQDKLSKLDIAELFDATFEYVELIENN